MGTITLRLPDDLHQGIELLAAQRKVSINKLYEELSSLLLRGYDAEMRFRKRASGGDPKKGLAILDKLEKRYAQE